MATDLIPVVEEALRGGGETPMQLGRPATQAGVPVAVMPPYKVCGQGFCPRPQSFDSVSNGDIGMH